MSQARVVVNNLNNGEISPKLGARVDIQRYMSSCRLLENGIPLPQGGVTRRPGTYFVAEAKDSTRQCRLVQFHYSTVKAYVIEFGHLYLRFYKDNGQMVTSYTAWQTSTAYALGDLVTNDGSYYRCIIAHTSGTFSTDLAAGKWQATAGASDLAYEIPSPYDENDLFDLKFVSSNDVMYIVHPDYAPYKLTRTSATTWSLAQVSFTCNDPETISGATKANPCVLTIAGHSFVAGDEIIVTDVGGMTELNNRLFIVSAPEANTVALKGVNSTDYTTYTSGGYAYLNPYTGQAASITNITKANPAVVTCPGHGFSAGAVVLIRDVGGMTQVNDRIFTVANPTTDTFQLSGVDSSSYSTYTSGGTVRGKPFTSSAEYPSCGCFYEQRLMLARGQTVWGSVVGDYENFQAGTADDYAFSYTLASDKADVILWMIAQNVCLVGTAGGVWRLSGSGSSADSPITPSNVQAKKQTGFGCANVDPELVDDMVMFIQRGGQRIREMGYSLEVDAYVATDMTMLAEHIGRGDTTDTSGFVDMDYQAEPLPIMWVVRRDGQLVGLLRDRSQQIAGWFRVTTGRPDTYEDETVTSVQSETTEDGETITMTLTRTESSEDVETWDSIESLAIITGEGQEDQVWVSVARTINGTTKRYIEYFQPYNVDDIPTWYIGLDSALTFDGGSPVAITNISKTNPAVVTAPSHGLTNGMKVRIYGVEGMTEVNQGLLEAYTVTSATADTFALSGIDATSFSAYTSGGYAVRVVNSVTGLDHLEGRSVDILVDGARHPRQVVSSGGVSLLWYGTVIHVGLPYRTVILPAKPDDAQSVGRPRRIYKVMARFLDTFGASWGRDLDSLDIVPFGTGTTPALYSGDVVYPFDATVDSNSDLYIVQEIPLPFTLLALMIHMEVF